jgi:hypothetical protein
LDWRCSCVEGEGEAESKGQCDIEEHREFHCCVYFC